MRTVRFRVLVLGLLTILLLAPRGSEARRCPPDSAQVGDACVDKYEASVWSIASSNSSLIRKVQRGKVTSAVELLAVAAHVGRGLPVPTG
jgi:hypothetical protein